MLLERGRDGGLSRRGETGEPDGEAGLLAIFVPLLARKGRVPSDVAGRLSVCLFAGLEADGGMVGFGGGHSRRHFAEFLGELSGE